MKPLQGNNRQFQSLPENMFRRIVSKLGASSPVDFCNARLSCKSLNFDLNDNVIAKDLNLTPLVNNRLAAKSYDFLIKSCLKVGNVDAHFIEGVLELFDRGNTDLGVHHLKIAAKRGHPEGTYLYGVMLMCFGRIEKGKTVLNNLTETEGITMVEGCWEKIEIGLSRFALEMKQVYLKSYESMQPDLHCHPEELYTVCSKCFHFYLVCEFIEMIMGLNTNTKR